MDDAWAIPRVSLRVRVTRNSVQLRICCAGASAIGRDFSGIYPRYSSSAGNVDSALQCVIRNIKDEKFLVGLSHVNDVSVREHHENIPPSFSRLRNLFCCSTLGKYYSIISNLMFFGKGRATSAMKGPAKTPTLFSIS
jgi:hypothetical protein